MKGQNILIINRWSDEFADYANYIDHRQNNVIYLVDAEGKKGVGASPDEIHGMIEVESLEDMESIVVRVDELMKRIGFLDKIIALSEWDLTMAATLRTRYGVPGITVEQVKLYKDKVAMKNRMCQVGVRIPQFIDCKSINQVEEFVSEIGYPIILKPKEGAASQGVHLVFEESHLVNLLREIELDHYECEEYVPGPILHVDGLVHEGELVYIRASRYINTCLEFNFGKPLGSYMIDDGALNSKLTAFTKCVLEGLELTNSAFHLEIILKNDEIPYFLEIGARVGGGEIPFLAKRLYDLDLIHEWVRIETGQFQKIALKNPERLGGFLMVPEPLDVPCKVRSATSLRGTLSTLVHEKLPQPGTLLDGHGGYELISGRFLFIGETSVEIEADILKAIQLFRLETEAVATLTKT